MHLSPFHTVSIVNGFRVLPSPEPGTNWRMVSM